MIAGFRPGVPVCLPARFLIYNWLEIPDIDRLIDESRGFKLQRPVPDISRPGTLS